MERHENVLLAGGHNADVEGPRDLAAVMHTVAPVAPSAADPVKELVLEAVVPHVLDVATAACAAALGVAASAIRSW